MIAGNHAEAGMALKPWKIDVHIHWNWARSRLHPLQPSRRICLLFRVPLSIAAEKGNKRATERAGIATLHVASFGLVFLSHLPRFLSERVPRNRHSDTLHPFLSASYSTSTGHTRGTRYARLLRDAEKTVLFSNLLSSRIQLDTLL